MPWNWLGVGCGIVMIRTFLIHDLVTLSMTTPGRPALPPLLTRSTVRFSSPAPVRTPEVFQNAPGLCDARQFGMERPGVIVTWFPLTLATVTTCDCERPPTPSLTSRPKLFPPSPLQGFGSPGPWAQTKMSPGRGQPSAVSSSWSRKSCVPGASPATLSSVMTVVPFAYPAVQLAVWSGQTPLLPPLHLPKPSAPPLKHTAPPLSNPQVEPVSAFQVIFVASGPCPRRVTLVFEMSMLPLRMN